MANQKKNQNQFEVVADVGWYQAILNTVIEALFLLDQEGIITALNPAAERLFGYQASEIVGRSRLPFTVN